MGKSSLAAVAIRKLRKEGFFSDGIVVVSCEHFKKATEVLLQVLSRFDSNRRVPEVNDLGDFWELAISCSMGRRF